VLLATGHRIGEGIDHPPLAMIFGIDLASFSSRLKFKRFFCSDPGLHAEYRNGGTEAGLWMFSKVRDHE
jgi:hypothetical protein